ncbi:hypothetical protein OQX61_07450 [Pedobacter sp. PLR]|uniref:hypothetical protein n=1 Tax=Pedobacter sp. PLR TaxID=2994465 RepID=UPI00224785BE|nr:hypothetical protein [Pedobacter sp. PLR]MCX2451104.1 hypothetical protein [Pedobacter sp. PLR]
MKLYKRVEDEILFWETWDIDDDNGAVNRGIVGQVGEYREVQSSILESFREKIQKEVDVVFENGYQEVDIEDHYTLLIEFIVDGMGTPEDVEKRTRLQDRMNDFLGWNGLGHCDGGSIGSGTMEVCCFVINFDIAKRFIEENLLGTEFANYIRIYDENEV